MPKVHLQAAFVADPPLPNNKAKIDYFDSQIPGFLLEVRCTGTSTYYFRYRDKAGMTKQFRIGNSKSISLENARSKAKAMKKQTVIGFDPREIEKKLKAVPTFRVFVNDHYLPHVKTHKRSWEQDKKAIESKLMRLWDHRKMNEITTQDLIGFQNTLSEAGMKPSSVNRYMALVKHIFNLAERWEMIDKSPSRNVRSLEDNNQKERFLSLEEMQRLLDALKTCKSETLPDIIEFLMLTGARKSEVVELEWKEIDMGKAMWTLPSERNKAKKQKVIPLSDSAMAILERRKGNDSAYVFPNPKTGKPMREVFRSWDRIRKAAGLDDVRIHDLRHTYASFLVNSGRSLYEVQKLWVIRVERTFSIFQWVAARDAGVDGTCISVRSPRRRHLRPSPLTEGGMSKPKQSRRGFAAPEGAWP